MRTSQVVHDGPTTGLFWYWVARLWMAVFGWDVEGEPPLNVRKAVLIAAPHTTNWDLPHMLAAAFLFRIRLSWMGKNSLFKPPFGLFMRWLGGVAVDRSAPKGQVQAVADLFSANERLILAVPPSGTRKRVEFWKSGFYWIAHTAQVPIVCAYLDYGRKRAGLGLTFVPSGDPAADMDRIREFYKDIRGKFPEAESPPRLKEEVEPQKIPTTPGNA